MDRLRPFAFNRPKMKGVLTPQEAPAMPTQTEEETAALRVTVGTMKRRTGSEVVHDLVQLKITLAQPMCLISLVIVRVVVRVVVFG